MERFKQGAVREIPSDAENVFAFQVDGELDADASEALSEYMNAAFDRHDTVHMLFDLTGFEGQDGAGIFSKEVVTSRLRSLSKVGRYAVIGAPDAADLMIRTMDKIIPVDAKTFAPEDRDDAWAFVGARPA